MGKTYPTRIEDAARKRFVFIPPWAAATLETMQDAETCSAQGCDRPQLGWDVDVDEPVCLVHICERAGIPLSPVDAFPDETTVTCANCGTSGVRNFYRMNGEWFCLPNCKEPPMTP